MTGRPEAGSALASGASGLSTDRGHSWIAENVPTPALRNAPPADHGSGAGVPEPYLPGEVFGAQPDRSARHLEQLSLHPGDAESLATVVRGAAEFPFTANMQCDAGFEGIAVAGDLGRRLG